LNAYEKIVFSAEHAPPRGRNRGREDMAEDKNTFEMRAFGGSLRSVLPDLIFLVVRVS